jgi:hypothetical protein
MKNVWLDTNSRLVNSLKRTLVEASYQPMYQEFPIRQFQYFINGIETEIVRLERENDKLKGKIKELENCLKEDTPDPVPDENVKDDKDETIQPI